MWMAQLILIVAGIYGSLGLLFGLWFVSMGMVRLDHAAQGSPWTFRLMIFPGVMLLWPVLLGKCLRVGAKQQ